MGSVLRVQGRYTNGFDESKLQHLQQKHPSGYGRHVWLTFAQKKQHGVGCLKHHHEARIRAVQPPTISNLHAMCCSDTLKCESSHHHLCVLLCDISTISVTWRHGTSSVWIAYLTCSNCCISGSVMPLREVREGASGMKRWTERERERQKQGERNREGKDGRT